MAAGKVTQWTAIYETRSSSDADVVRTTLEVAGFRVSIDGPGSGSSTIPLYDGPGALTISVPTEDADDARDFLRQKTSLLDSDASPSNEADESSGDQGESIEDAAKEVLEIRGQHHVAACRYCGIPTLYVSEAGLESHAIALLRAAGLGVNSATFSEFAAGERICSECAGHEVTCDLCGRTLDAFLDEGEYRRANDDEAYVCSACRGQLEDQLQSARDW